MCLGIGGLQAIDKRTGHGSSGLPPAVNPKRNWMQLLASCRALCFNPNPEAIATPPSLGRACPAGLGRGFPPSLAPSSRRLVAIGKFINCSSRFSSSGTRRDPLDSWRPAHHHPAIPLLRARFHLRLPEVFLTPPTNIPSVSIPPFANATKQTHTTLLHALEPPPPWGSSSDSSFSVRSHSCLHVRRWSSAHAHASSDFKSYKGHHVLQFGDSYFTSIIGPNGSGKSNS